MNVNHCISRKNLLVAIAVLAIGLVLTGAMARPIPAFAADSSSAASSAAAPSASAESPKDAVDAKPLGGLPMMGDDYVWFGQDLKMTNATVKNDLIAAGQNISIVESMVAGDMRLAGENISIKDSTTVQNITAAGQSVSVLNGNGKAVALAGQDVSFSGSCKELSAYAENVRIDGTVEGDVVVGATNVVIGTDAKIKGTLYVSASNEPVMERGSEVGDVEFTQVEGASSDEIESAAASFALTMRIMFAIFGVIGTFITALLAEWLFRRHTAAAANMIRTRTGATIGSGVVGAIVAPVAVIIMFCLGFTAVAAVGVIFALIAMTVLATGFMGASIFKLAFPKLGRFKCAMAGGAIMGVASAIPFLGFIVDVAAFMYFLGYVLQSIFLGMRDPEAPASNAQAAPVAPTYPTVPNMQGMPMGQGAPMVSNMPPATNAPTAPTMPYTQTPPPGGAM